MTAFNGTTGNDTLTGTSGNDTLNGGLGADTMNGGGGSDTFIVDNALDVIVETAGQGPDTVLSSVGFSATALPGVANITLTGTGNIRGFGNSGNNVITGNAGNNRLGGHGGSDTLIGGGGNDTFEGGSGADTLEGGKGADVYVFADGDGRDLITDMGGADKIQFDSTVTADSVTYVQSGNDLAIHYGSGNTATVAGFFASAASKIESVVFSDGTVQNDAYIAAHLTSHQTIAGTTGDDTLTDVGPGNTLMGGAGNDTYILHNAGDFIAENPGEGTDLVKSTLTISIASMANVENLKLSGTADIGGSGNGGDNVITGNSGNNMLYGRGGNDTLVGDGGNDTFSGDTGADTMTGGAGNDTFLFAAGDGQDVVSTGGGSDSVVFAATVAPSAVTYTQSGSDLVIHDGNGGDSITVSGFFSSAANQVAVNFNDGTVQDAAYISAHLTTIANLTLTGTSGNDTLTGGVGNDTLTGGAGDDLLKGGGGNDLFVFAAGDGQDTISDYGGTDTISFGAGVSPAATTFTQRGFDLVIADGQGDTVTALNYFKGASGGAVHFSDGTIDDAAFINAHLLEASLTIAGTAGKDTLVGAPGNDTITGGPGNDTLTGGGGADTFLMSSGSGHDVITDFGGSDTIKFDASVSPANVTFARNGTDLLIIDGPGDSITAQNYFSAPGGQLLFSNGTVADAAFIQAHLIPSATVEGSTGTDTLTGGIGDDTLSGGAGDDVLIGGGGSDTMDGGAGADKMTGGLGDDTYVVDNAGDVIIDAGGSNTVIDQMAKGSYVLSANTDTLILGGKGALQVTGNADADMITGNGAANLINDGGGAADTLAGGGGNDTYVVSNSADVIVESAAHAGGLDSVQSSVSYVLADNVERLTLTGAGNIDGTGNGLNNLMTGNSGDNTLDGGAGIDVLRGGLGDDTYVVDLVATRGTVKLEDAVSDTGGNDTLVLRAGDLSAQMTHGAATFALAPNIENLDASQVDMRDALNLNGNAFNNILIANNHGDTLNGMAGADTLIGGTGNDVLSGGAGHDTLTGAAGADVFLFHRPEAVSADNADTITDFRAGAGGDRIDIEEILPGYKTGSADAFVHLTSSGTDTVVSVDANGAAGGENFIAIATLQNVSLASLVDADHMIAAGNLVV